MKFSDFSKASQQFNQFSPEMKEQMMRMAKARVQEKLKKWLATPTFVVLAILIGAVVGALTACFGDIMDRLNNIREAHPLYIIPFLALGGAGIVFAYRKWGKWSDRGMDQVFAVGLNKESNLPLISIPMAAVGSWITQFLGGSAGREGAAMQIGSVLSYNISKKLPFENASHIMLVTGMAAGFAGIFQTPMAATAFALEVLLVGHFELAALLPAAAAAFTASEVSALLGFHKFTANIDAFTIDAHLIVKIALLGILFGILGGGFAKLLSLSRDFAEKKFQNPIKRVAILGVSLSALLLLLFQGRYAGLGTNLLASCFSGNTADIYAFDWVFKFALTIVTLSAGFVGGVATPLFAIGATFGAFASTLFGIPLPLAAALGFSAVFASATNTLWAPILIGLEIFGFDCAPAFFVVCVVAYACNGGQSIYKQKKIRIKL